MYHMLIRHYKKIDCKINVNGVQQLSMQSRTAIGNKAFIF